MIMDSRPEVLHAFASSGRLHAIDPKGDTPLHIAARMGNLQACDLFIRAGSNPSARNHADQIPAEVARVEGHAIAADLLLSLVGSNGFAAPSSHSVPATAEARGFSSAPDESVQPALVEAPDESFDWDDAEPLLDFQPELTAHEFIRQNATAEGGAEIHFAPIISVLPAISDEAPDWNFDHGGAEISGDGIGAFTAPLQVGADENDFLKVQGKGRQSIRTAVVPSGTRLSIDPAFCRRWTRRAIERRYASEEDLNEIIFRCRGNGVSDDLRENLILALSDAGIPIMEHADFGAGLWDIRSDVSFTELYNSVETVLSRATRLPGIGRFDMSKANEDRVVAPLLAARTELQLLLLKSASATETLLADLYRVRDGELEPVAVTMKSVLIDDAEDTESSSFFGALDTLLAWRENGKVTEGRQRRQALGALDRLDLSQSYLKSLVLGLVESEDDTDCGVALADSLSRYEAMIDQLITHHLPFVRRLAARSVEDGDDPEDVFQVAFTGLQRSTRRFDPSRGQRFVVYSQYWMRQAINRWRADEGDIVRIPVHAHGRLAKYQQALDLMVAFESGFPSDAAVADLAELAPHDVRNFHQIPRIPCELSEYENSDRAAQDAVQIENLSWAEAEVMIAEMLEDLPERYADVLRRRFGIGYEDEMTLEEVGQLYGVTRERIRQIEAKALLALSMPQRLRRLRWLLEH